MRFESWTVSVFIVLRPVATMPDLKRPADDEADDDGDRLAKKRAVLAVRKEALLRELAQLEIEDVTLGAEEEEEAARSAAAAIAFYSQVPAPDRLQNRR